MAIFKRISPHGFILLLIVLPVLGSACSLLEWSQVPSPPPAPQDLPEIPVPSPTQEPTIASTATPTPLIVWVSAAVPPALRTTFETFASADQASIKLVDDETLSQVQVEPFAEHILATWTYAFVAPFPTTQDDISFETLQRAWDGGGDPFRPILVSPSTHGAMTSLLGESSDELINQVARESLLEYSWAARTVYAVVPFEDLDPRWKVLSVDGISPIRVDFDPDAYPLTVPFGLSGNPSDVQRLKDLIPWPTTNRDPLHMTVLVMTGVTALTRGTAYRMDLHGATYPGEKIGDWLREADWTHVSNEVSFSESCPPPDPYTAELRFCSAPSHLALLEHVGVDLVELTGNHVLDWGAEAFLFTLDLYTARDWKTFGGGADLKKALLPAIVEHNGNRLAFLGCNAAGPQRAWATDESPGATPCDEDQLFREVSRLRDEGYLVVFTYQWAEGAALMPAQREAFRAVVDAGAVIVSGSQAHQPMGFEFYEAGLIHYGLGNLFFDQMQRLELRQEFIDRHVFYEGRHISTELLTALLVDYSQPRPMTSDERLVFLQGMFSKSGW
ncbi:MAG: hypothetical protein GTO14_11705 [Anaerolineales bacterium]|nr:hypothetical protein [Anaerolineales bacterium]